MDDSVGQSGFSKSVSQHQSGEYFKNKELVFWYMKEPVLRETGRQTSRQTGR